MLPVVEPDWTARMRIAFEACILELLPLPSTFFDCLSKLIVQFDIVSSQTILPLDRHKILMELFVFSM
ncbi:MAG: hypothetical protein JWN25_2337 [Verrucomicrobiales bacterium]|nr:hypothetical protein [Verrucomicrobiales bacterium]